MMKQRLIAAIALLAGLLPLLSPCMAQGQGKPFIITTLTFRKYTPPAPGGGGNYYDYWLKIPVNGENYKVHYEGEDGKNGKDITVAQGIIDVNVYRNDFVVKIGPENVKSIAYAGKVDEYGALHKIQQWGDVKWQTMEGAFEGCKEVWYIDENLGKPDLSQVTSCARMFAGVEKLYMPLADWDVSAVTDMSQMFQGCSKFFNNPMGNWNVSKVKNMSHMFEGCEKYNQPLDQWNVSQVEDMERMFEGCTSFNQSLANWKLRKCKKLGLGHCGMSVENYSKTLQGWAAQADIVTGLTLDATGLVYTHEAKVAREKLITEKGWIITGDTEVGIQFVPAEESMSIGQEKALKLQFNGITKEAVSLASSKDNIVKVLDQNNLTVKALAVGQATITATLPASGSQPKLTATCVVTVTKGVESITLNKSALTLWRGDSEKLSATVLPEDLSNREVTWACEPASVATVDNDGTVHAVGAGQATITATTKAMPSKSATCALTVNIKVDGLVLDKTNMTLKVGESQTITAIVTPEGLPDKSVTWESDHADIASVVDGTVKGLKPGMATITVTTVAEPKVSKTCTVTVEQAAVNLVLDKTEMTLKVGESQTITATVTPEGLPDKSVTWESDHADIASVVDGTVKGLKPGMATITVTTVAEPKVSKTCTVTVEQAAINLALDKTEMTLKVGESQTITATVTPEGLPDKSVTWESDHADIASVVDGTVKGLKPGMATITVTTVAEPKVSKTCTVTVENIRVTGIEISRTSLALTVGEGSTLTAQVLPREATVQDIEWTSSQPAIVSVDKGAVMAHAAGEAEITAKSVDGGFTATCKVTVKAKSGSTPNGQNGTKSALEHNGLNGVEVSPNPFGPYLHVSSPIDVERYELVNISGQVVAREWVQSSKFRIETEHLPAGIYLLRLTGAHGEIHNVRIVK